MAVAAAPALSDDALVEVLSLIADADSVELKLSIAEPRQRSTLEALGMDPLGARVRLVSFFDTPELTLERHGVVVRARRTAQKGDDSVVKLRPVVPSELPAEVRESPMCMVEVDAMPGGYVCSASLKGLPKTPVQDVAAGTAPLRKLFSKEQRAFFAEHAPDGHRVRRPLPAGPGLRAQAEVLATGVRAPDGRGALALPRRDPRSSSCRRSARRRRPSRSPPSVARSWPSAASSRAPPRPRRPARRWSSSPSSGARPEPARRQGVLGAGAGVVVVWGAGVAGAGVDVVGAGVVVV